MNITLPSNLFYFNLLEILFGASLVVFACMQWALKFKVALTTRTHKRLGLIACMVVFFTILGVQIHLGLPENTKYLNYIYAAIGFAVLMEIIQFFYNGKKMDHTKVAFRNIGLIVLGIVFITIGILTRS